MMYKMWANFESFLHLHCFISVSESVSLSHRRLPWPPCWFLSLLTLIVNTAWSTVLLREEIVRIFEFSTLFRLPFFVNEERQCCLCVIGWFVFSCCKKIVCGRTTLKSEIVCCGTQNWAQKLSVVVGVISLSWNCLSPENGCCCIHKSKIADNSKNWNYLLSYS